MSENRTNATRFLDAHEALNELDRLKFAVVSLVQRHAPGSHARENADNAAKGIKARIDYLYDSLRMLLEGKS